MNETENGRRMRWYEVVYIAVLLLLLVGTLFFGRASRVGVVDMDRVFRDVGMLARIEQDRRELEAFQRGTRMVETHNQRVSELNKQLDAATTKAEKDKLQAQIRQASDQLQQSLAPVQAALQRHETMVLSTFRRRVQPFVTKVARRRRLDVVLYAGPHVLYTRDKVDLTDEVTAAAKSFFAKKDLPLIDPALETTTTPAGRR